MSERLFIWLVRDLGSEITELYTRKPRYLAHRQMWIPDVNWDERLYEFSLGNLVAEGECRRLVRKNGVTLGAYGKNEHCWEVADA